MDGGLPLDPARIGIADLGRLMPMFVWIGPDGGIRAVGPTLARLCGPDPLAGEAFLSHFEVRKPHAILRPADLEKLVGHRLQLVLRSARRTALRGLAVPLKEGQGIFVNLSFGISVTDAVRDHDLTYADFAPTDLTVELLFLAEVKAAVMGELAALNLRLQDARRIAEEEALSDALTGLANRRAFDRAISRAIEAAARGGPGFALLHLDLDYFKSVNDTLGHAAGDHVLTHVAAVLRRETRQLDIAARIGGDEFVLLLGGPIDAPAVARIAARIIAGLEEPVEFEGQMCRVSGSIGAALSSAYPAPDIDTMLADADAALYRSKRAGRSRCTVHGGADDAGNPTPP